MEGFCNRCGDCCDHINTSWSHQDIRDRTEEDDPNRFVLEHWKEIRHWVNDDGVDRYEYECDQFQTETRTCGAADRPPVCTGYPYYSNEGNERVPEYTQKRCSYWYDVPQDKWPEGMKLLPVI